MHPLKFLYTCLKGTVLAELRLTLCTAEGPCGADPRVVSFEIANRSVMLAAISCNVLGLIGEAITMQHPQHVRKSLTHYHTLYWVPDT